MKKIRLFPFLLIALFFVLTAGATHAQQLISKDSTYYGDTTVTFNVAGYEDIYIDVYNTNADSTNSLAFFGTNYSGWDVALGIVDQSSSYNYSTVTTVASAASSKKTYKVNSNGWQYIKIINNDMNGAANKVYFELKAIRKTQF